MDRAIEYRLILHAYKYGHFRNPDYPETHQVNESDLAILTPRDEVARQAIASVQVSDLQVDLMCQRMFHGRALALDQDGKADGDPGPATIALLDIPRCDVPDFMPDTDDDFGLAGAGGWLQCDDERDHDHEVVIMFDDRNASSTWRGYLDEVKRNAVEISADIGLSVRYIQSGSSETYQSSVLFKNIPGGVIGYYYLPQGAGCRRVPQGALDTSYNPDVQMASLLWIHEGLGHGIGLGHTRGGIMNPSIMRTSISWRNDPSWNTIKRLYGGEPLVSVDPPDPPTPDPPSPPGDKWVIEDGTIKIRHGNSVNTFRLIESSGA